MIIDKNLIILVSSTFSEIIFFVWDFKAIPSIEMIWENLYFYYELSFLCHIYYLCYC
jgi:hypothetical protein